MNLTPAHVQKIKPPASGQQKHFDGAGLFLLVSSTGSKGWRLKYQFHGKEKLLSLGPYPAVSLPLARDRAAEARKLLGQGVDPSAARQAEQAAERKAAGETFATVGAEYLRVKGKALSERTLRKTTWLLETILRKLHKVPVSELTAPDVLRVIRAIEADGRNETAHRAAQFATRVMRYAVQTGRVKANPIAELRGALEPVRVTSHPAITEPRELAQLLHAIDSYHGYATVRHALQLEALVFLRPGELRSGEWSEIQDLHGKDPIWVIPGPKMKMRRPHVIPLARQAVALLKDQLAISGGDRWIFPGGRGDGRHLSDGALTMALKSMFFKGDHTVHGFRSTASTLLHEMRFDPAIIELQLAHVKKDAVAAVYDRSQRLPERRAMLERWADYLDEIRAKNFAAELMGVAV